MKSLYMRFSILIAGPGAAAPQHAAGAARPTRLQT